MRRRHFRLAATLPIAISLALVSGCGGGDDDDSEGTKVTASDGSYELVLPEGWRDLTEETLERTEEVEGTTALGQYQGPEGLVFVQVSDPPAREPKDTASYSRGLVDPDKPFRGVRFTVGPLYEFEIDGEKAAGYVQDIIPLEPTPDNPDGKVRHDYTKRGESGGYSVTFSAGEEQYEAALPEYESILDSWRWTD